MGIIIGGIEKPDRCVECDHFLAYGYGDCHCRAKDGKDIPNDLIMIDRIPRWCPQKSISGLVDAIMKCRMTDTDESLEKTKYFNMGILEACRVIHEYSSELNGGENDAET